MKNYDELYQKYLDATEEERIKDATIATNFIIDDFRQNLFLSLEAAIDVLLKAISIFICADNVVNYKEYIFVKKYTGIDINDDEFFEAMKGGGKLELVEEFDDLIDNSSEEFKEQMLILGLCICAANGKFEEKERGLIKKLVE